MTSTVIIAEAGVNHNGDLDLARRLIEAAASAGADLVKFQTFSADRIVTRSAPKAEYQRASSADAESQFDMLRRLELSREMHVALIEACRRCGIGFFSTGFDEASVAMLVELGAERIKVPSGELTNLPFLRKVGSFGLDVYLSTGMSDVDEVAAAIEVLEKAGTARERITVLHCSSEYPTPMEDVNLRAMLTMQAKFDVAVGYSDHTAGIEVAIAAVALGAAVLEKHFTLDRRLPGPDHRASLEPRELAAMVASVRNIERALGDGIKRPMASEARNRQLTRRSIVAGRAIRAGELLTERNLVVKRPGTGMSPMRWDAVVGTRAQRDYAPDELIDP